MTPYPTAPAGKRFLRSISSGDLYLWDNAGYAEAGRLHIYAQAADRMACADSGDRYRIAYWRHFASDDGGETWLDEGPALVQRDSPGAFDGQAIWSGNVLPLADGTKLAAYTGLERGKLAMQSIALAASADGRIFERLSLDRPLLSPSLDYDELRAAGYYLGPRETLGDIEREADGTFLCLRDPFLFENADGLMHVFFGAKAALGDRIVRAVGHAMLERPGSEDASARILPPQLVPDGDQFNMLELPNVFRRDGYYYLIISTTNLEYYGQPDLESRKMVRIYRSTDLDGGWQPYGDEGKHILLRPESRLYGLNIIVSRDVTESPILCRAFWVGDNWLPPSLELCLGKEAPELLFPQDLGTAG